MKRFLFDMHVHTAEVSPCGNVSARELVSLYKGKGYDGIVITDHYSDYYFHHLGSLSWDKKTEAFLKGYQIAKEAGEKIGLNVLLGMELAFCGGNDDQLIYGFNEEFLYQHPALHTLTPKKLREVADRHNLLIYQAHPFRSYISRRYLELVDGLEVYNGNMRHASNDYLAEELALKNGLLQISGSDFHELEDLARGGTWLPKNPADEVELVHILKNSKVSIIKSE